MAKKLSILDKLLELRFIKKGTAYYKEIDGLGYIKIEIITDDILRKTTRHEDGDIGSYIKSEYITVKQFMNFQL